MSNPKFPTNFTQEEIQELINNVIPTDVDDPKVVIRAMLSEAAKYIACFAGVTPTNETACVGMFKVYLRQWDDAISKIEH